MHNSKIYVYNILMYIEYIYNKIIIYIMYMHLRAFVCGQGERVGIKQESKIPHWLLKNVLEM